jgi:transposase-like protein
MAKIRVRRSRAVWEELVRRYRESGLSIAKFAAQQDIPEATLGRWVAKLSAPARAAPDRGPRLIPVVRRATASAVWLELGPTRVEVRPGFDRALVADLVQTLAAVFA